MTEFSYLSNDFPYADGYHIEYPAEKLMFRLDAETGEHYVKRYGSAMEEAIEPGYDLLNDVYAGPTHRVIPAERYWMDRPFDAFYGSGFSVLVDSTLDPSDILGELEMGQSIEPIGPMEATPARGSDRPSQRFATVGFPFGLEVRNLMDRSTRQWAERQQMPATATAFQIKHPAFEKEDPGQYQRQYRYFDPARHRHLLEATLPLLSAPHVRYGKVAVGARAAVAWGTEFDGITVTTDEDLFWSVGGALLLPFLDENDIDYQHVTMTRDDLESGKN